MNKALMASGLIPLLLAASSSSSAIEWLSGSELEASCDRFLEDTVSSEGVLCVAYMQGFLAGANASASHVSGKANEAARAGDESFSDRAARTRLGTLRLQQLATVKTTGYCVDDTVLAVDIVEAIAIYLKEHPETLYMTDADAVRQALVYHYPCEQ